MNMRDAVQPALLKDVRIDEATWRCANEPRHAEWRQAIAELVEDGTFTLDPDGKQPGRQDGARPIALRGRVALAPDAVKLSLFDGRDDEVGRMELQRPVLAPLLREYTQLVTSLESALGDGTGSLGDPAPRVEAIDIARRLLHDDAAELLRRSCVGARPDHKTARRLFTLLVLLTHDTTGRNLASAWPA
jgi:uncharacterized protein (UPF0262 family)